MFIPIYISMGLRSQRKRILSCSASILLFSLFVLSGCNAPRTIPRDTSPADTPHYEQPKTAAYKEKAATNSPCADPNTNINALFDKMEAIMYQGDPTKYGDIVFRDGMAENQMDPVVFSHQTHRTRYTCRVCHLELEFSMKQGESGMTRDDCRDGRYCASCHNGKVAFNLKDNCQRCHVTVDANGNYTSKKLAVKGLSKQKYGDGVNWVKSLHRGVISPQTSLDGEENPSTMPLPGHLQKTSLRWTAKSPSYPVSLAVAFPHNVHVQWLDCANCHPDIFMVQKNGTVKFDKDKVLEGKFCGVCHLKVAFPMDGCRRCHPKKTKKK